MVNSPTRHPFNPFEGMPEATPVPEPVLRKEPIRIVGYDLLGFDSLYHLIDELSQSYTDEVLVDLIYDCFLNRIDARDWAAVADLFDDLDTKYFTESYSTQLTLAPLAVTQAVKYIRQIMPARYRYANRLAGDLEDASILRGLV